MAVKKSFAETMNVAKIDLSKVRTKYFYGSIRYFQPNNKINNACQFD